MTTGSYSSAESYPSQGTLVSGGNRFHRAYFIHGWGWECVYPYYHWSFYEEGWGHIPTPDKNAASVSSPLWWLHYTAAIYCSFKFDLEWSSSLFTSLIVFTYYRLIHVHINAYYTYVHTYIHTNIHTCNNAYYTYVHTYIHTNIHTCTHQPTHTPHIQVQSQYFTS